MGAPDELLGAVGRAALSEVFPFFVQGQEGSIQGIMGLRRRRRFYSDFFF
jgi:hypothetical protein